MGQPMDKIDELQEDGLVETKLLANPCDDLRIGGRACVEDRRITRQCALENEGDDNNPYDCGDRHQHAPQDG